jgi:hypothetical protein
MESCARRYVAEGVRRIAQRKQVRSSLDRLFVHCWCISVVISSFIEFWGRARKLGGEDAKKIEEDEVCRSSSPRQLSAYDRIQDEGEEGGGTADLKALARGIDAEKVIAVIQVRHKSQM